MSKEPGQRFTANIPRSSIGNIEASTKSLKTLVEGIKNPPEKTWLDKLSKIWNG